jgi:hypothetical protein
MRPPERQSRLSAVVATAALAVSLSGVAGGSPEARASVSVRSFAPVARTRDALVFRIAGVDPVAIRRASATLRRRSGGRRTSTLSLRATRAAIQRGTLRVRRGSREVVGGRIDVALRRPARFHVPSWVPSGCSTDAAAPIRSWIASVPDHSTLVFDAGACYRVESPLELRGRSLAIDGHGATFRSFDPPEDQRAVWRAWDSTVAFRDMTIVGAYADGGVHVEALQHAHAIDLRGTYGAVERVSMSDLAGDCVYFGLGRGRSSGYVRDSSCRRISRNAVSVTAGDDIRVTRVTTDRIGYVAFDVEPNEGPGNGSARVVFAGNTIGSYGVKAYTVIGNAPVVDQVFADNRVVGQGLKIGTRDGPYRPRRVRITGNRSDTPTAPAAMNLQGLDDVAVTGNTVPMLGGSLVQALRSCGVRVAGNAFPGGLRQAAAVGPAC